MDFAVVKVAGKQYLVSENDQIQVNADFSGQKNVVLDTVLLLSQDSQLQLGKPLVEGAAVKADVVSTGLGEKMRVAKFKAKSRYRRVMGFRPQLTTLRITSVSSAPAKKQVAHSKATKQKKESGK